MERVAFLVEDSGVRIDALLNPETVRVRRRAGLRTLGDRPGTIAGAGGRDDRLLATGGGRTDVELDLVFDLDLLPTGRLADDVRELTAPIWQLAENRTVHGRTAPPGCRFVWGKAWNVPAVVEAVSESFERFDDHGVPRRSWLRLRLVRTTIPEVPRPDTVAARAAALVAESMVGADDRALGEVRLYEVRGAGDDAVDGERLDAIAARELGDPAYWRALAVLNDIDDPPWVAAGRVLRIPPRDVLAAPTPVADPAAVAAGEAARAVLGVAGAAPNTGGTR